MLPILMDEDKYWDMTPAKLNRFIEAYNTAHTTKLKEQAMMDYRHAYTLAIMINKSFAGKSDWPSVMDIYNNLWTDDDKTDMQDSISAANFMQFAKLYNTNPKEE